jgi:hypothetical protein
LEESAAPSDALALKAASVSTVQIYANDCQDLEQLCRYGARSAILQRLEETSGGVAFLSDAAPDGSTHPVLTPLALLEKLSHAGHQASRQGRPAI